MVVEQFRGGDAVPVYRRFKTSGRMAADGLAYVSSWVDESFTTCYQLMEADDRSLLEDWMNRWTDLIEFEVHAVLTSQEVVQRLAPKLDL
jgi:hypothetical protein